jgi:hypothetical protein
LEKVVFLKKIESSHISLERKKHLRNPTGIKLYFSDWKTEHRGKSCQKNIPNDAFQTTKLNLSKNRFQIIFLLFLFSLSKLRNLANRLLNTKARNTKFLFYVSENIF